MISETQFKMLYDRASTYKYSSLGPLEYNDCINVEILYDVEDMILLIDNSKEPRNIYWAANDPHIIIQKIENIAGAIHIDSVPEEFIEYFQNAGFSLWAEFVDFFNNELEKTDISICNDDDTQLLKPEEISIVDIIAKLCVGQSRGFGAEKKEWFLDWVKENDIIIIKEGDEIAGYCCVSIYASGTILWVRRIAVNPLFQRKGFGRKLLEQAIFYGVKRGAKRGFLHADILNKNAISLYNKYGFNAKGDSGEIHMIRYCSSFK